VAKIDAMPSVVQIPLIKGVFSRAFGSRDNTRLRLTAKGLFTQGTKEASPDLIQPLPCRFSSRISKLNSSTHASTVRLPFSRIDP
jgi:hypothetical protein